MALAGLPAQIPAAAQGSVKAESAAESNASQEPEQTTIEARPFFDLDPEELIEILRNRARASEVERIGEIEPRQRTIVDQVSAEERQVLKKLAWERPRIRKAELNSADCTSLVNGAGAINIDIDLLGSLRPGQKSGGDCRIQVNVERFFQLTEDRFVDVRCWMPFYLARIMDLDEKDKSAVVILSAEANVLFESQKARCGTFLQEDEKWVRGEDFDKRRVCLRATEGDKFHTLQVEARLVVSADGGDFAMGKIASASADVRLGPRCDPDKD